MTPAAAGVIVGTIIGGLVGFAIFLVIGASVLKLACRICGEEVTFPGAMGIVFVNGLAQLGISLVVNLGIVPQLEPSPATVGALMLGTLVVNMLVASTIISSMVPTTFPKAIAIWLMQLVVVAAFLLVVVLVVSAIGLSLLPRGSSRSPSTATETVTVPADTRFITEALAELRTLEGFEGGGEVAAIPAPAPGGGVVVRPRTPSDGAGVPSASQFTRPGAEAMAPQIISWEVQPDPPAEVVTIPAEKPVRIAVPPNIFTGHDVLFPTAASPFVAVGRHQGNNALREVWDLRTRRRVAQLAGRSDMDEKPMALSPDGQSLAGRIRNSVQVWSFATGRPLGQVELVGGDPDFFDFAGPDRIVVGSSAAKRIEVWDIKQGQKPDAVITTPSPIARESVTISPGGRYLAGASKEDGRLRVYDLQAGQPAGEQALGKDGIFAWTPQGSAFSPDGTELAAVFESFGKVRVVCWKVADGSVAAEAFLDTASGVKRAFGYEDHGIQWMPGLDAWLLFGEAVVDRRTGRKVHTFPFDRETYPPSPRRPLDARRMLIVVGDRNRTVGDAEIPEQVSQALAAARGGEGAVAPPQPPP